MSNLRGIKLICDSPVYRVVRKSQCRKARTVKNTRLSKNIFVQGPKNKLFPNYVFLVSVVILLSPMPRCQRCTCVNVQIPQGCLWPSFIKTSSWKAYKCRKTPSASPMCIYQESRWARLEPPRLTQAVSCRSRDHARINIPSSVLEPTSEAQ